MNEEINFNGQLTVHQMVESIIGCKWSLTVIDLIRRGIHRPGRMEHAIEGLSAKVLNERLTKLQHFGIIDKRVFAETPPRTEYHLTDFGRRFLTILDAVEKLQASVSADWGQRP